MKVFTFCFSQRVLERGEKKYVATRCGLEPGTSGVHDGDEPVPADQAGCLDKPFCGYRQVTTIAQSLLEMVSVVVFSVYVVPGPVSVQIIIMKLFFFFFTTVHGQTGFTDLYTRSLWMGQSTVQRPSHQLTQVHVGQSFECLKILTKYYVNELLTLILDLYTFLKSDIP